MRLQDKIAIVTGAGSGFGAGIARKFAAEGARVVVADLKAGRLVEVLPDCNPGDGEDIHALYAPEDRAAARIRAFLDFLDRSATRLRSIERPGAAAYLYFL